MTLRVVLDIEIPAIEGWSKEIAEAFVTMFKAIVEGAAAVAPWGPTRYNITAGLPPEAAAAPATPPPAPPARPAKRART